MSVKRVSSEVVREIGWPLVANPDARRHGYFATTPWQVVLYTPRCADRHIYIL